MDMVVVKKMAMKHPNRQGVRMSGNCDVFEDADLLEEILVRVPHEFIFNCILVSKRWFGLICGSCFREHYIRRWSEEVNLLQRRLQSRPLAEASELKNRLQSQQLAALDRLQHRLTENQLHHLPYYSRPLAECNQRRLRFLNQEMHRLHYVRVDVVNELHHKLQSDAEIVDKLYDVFGVFERLKSVNELEQWCESKVLVVVKESLRQLPSHQLAAVNELQHQILCQLLAATTEVQRQKYWDMFMV